MHLGQAAGKVNVCGVCSSNILTSITHEFARENGIVHIGVIHVSSGANSNRFLRLQLGEISNTEKQFLRVYLLEEEPCLYPGLVSESFVLQRLQAYLL